MAMGHASTKEWKGAFSPRMAENTKDPGGIGVLRPFPGPRKNKDQKFRRGVPNPRGKTIGSKRGNEGSVELLKECSNIPPMSEALATSEKSEEGSPELPEKSGDEGQTA